MCGRYYIDDEMEAEIRKILKNIDIKMDQHREVFPTNTAPVITTRGDMQLNHLTWGFKHWDPSKKSILINARAETVLERKMFRDSVINRRCVVPASGFYEWDKNKHKISFFESESKALYLAGFWKNDRFIIITTKANHSIADVHDRMPLILEASEIETWLFDDDIYKIILQKEPGKLDRKPV